MPIQVQTIIEGVTDGVLVGARDELIVEVAVAPSAPEHLKPLYANVPKIGLWNSPTTHDGALSRSMVVVIGAPGVFVIIRSNPSILKLGFVLRQQLFFESVLLDSDACSTLSLFIMWVEEYVLL